MLKIHLSLDFYESFVLEKIQNFRLRFDEKFLKAPWGVSLFKSMEMAPRHLGEFTNELQELYESTFWGGHHAVTLSGYFCKRLRRRNLIFLELGETTDLQYFNTALRDLLSFYTKEVIFPAGEKTFLLPLARTKFLDTYEYALDVLRNEFSFCEELRPRDLQLALKKDYRWALKHSFSCLGHSSPVGEKASLQVPRILL